MNGRSTPATILTTTIRAMPTPTAYQGIEAAETSEYRARFDAITALIHTVKYICGLAGFEVVGRITLRHKQSGDIYK